MKHTHGGVLILLHGCFSHFLNCANSGKLRNTYYDAHFCLRHEKPVNTSKSKLFHYSLSLGVVFWKRGRNFILFAEVIGLIWPSGYTKFNRSGSININKFKLTTAFGLYGSSSSFSSSMRCGFSFFELLRSLNPDLRPNRK